MNTLAVRELDGPLVSAAEARNLWKEYQELEEAILTDDDYMWFVEFQAPDNSGRMRLRKYTYNTHALAEADLKNHQGGIVKKRKVKSATRKMGKFFALEMPIEEELGTGQVEIREQAGFIIQIERSKFYTLTTWMDQELQTVKASATVVVRSPSGRTWVGNGGSHRKEGRDDFAIAQTAFTRALNRAILDFVGFGEESAEETSDNEPVPGEQAPPAQQSAAQQQTPAKAPTKAQQASSDKRREISKIVTEKNITPEFMRNVIANNFKKEKMMDLTNPQLDRLLKVVQDTDAPGGAQQPSSNGSKSPTAPPEPEATQSAPPSDTAPESQPAGQDAGNSEASGAKVVDGTARVVEGKDGSMVTKWAQDHHVTDGETGIILGMNLVRYFEAGHSDLDAIMTLDKWCREHRPDYTCGDMECICTQQRSDVEAPPEQEAPAEPDIDDLPF